LAQWLRPPRPPHTHLLGAAEQHEAQRHHRRAPHVVRHVGDRAVQQPRDCAVVGGAAVGQPQRLHRAPPQDGVLVARHLLHQRVGALLPAVRREREAEGQAADDLLVRRVVGVGLC
jgi:hypothetical protein